MAGRLHQPDEPLRPKEAFRTLAERSADSLVAKRFVASPGPGRDPLVVGVTDVLTGDSLAEEPDCAYEPTGSVAAAWR